MNKLFSKIATLSVGLAMAVGVGVALGHQGVREVRAADTTDVTYTIADYPAGTQYAENEEHVLDSVLTIYTNGCHFTSEIRMYQDTSARTNWVKFSSLKKISGLKINANCNTKGSTTTYKLQGSNDGGTSYSDISTKTTVNGQKYGNLTFDGFGSNTYTTLLLKNTGTLQGRVKSITVTYVNESVVVSGVTVSGETNVSSGYLGFRNIKYNADVIYSTGQGDESVTWTTNNTKNTINSDGVLHITANEETIVTATSVEDPSVFGSITVSISGLVSKEFDNVPVAITTASIGTSNITSTTAGTPAVFDSGNIRFSVDKASSQSDPGFYATNPVSVRVYGGATVTVSTIDGNNMYFLSLRSENAGNQMSAAVVSLSTGSMTIDENGVAFIDMSAAPSSSITISASAQVRFDAVNVYYYTQTDAEAVQEFVDTYMHMDDYNENLGYCLDSNEHHYYSSAKAAFNGLSGTRRNLFMTDGQFSAAKARLQAWANANGDVFDGENSLTSGAYFNGSISDNNSYIIIIVISAVSVMSFGLALFLRKKRSK